MFAFSLFLEAMFAIFRASQQFAHHSILLSLHGEQCLDGLTDLPAG